MHVCLELELGAITDHLTLDQYAFIRSFFSVVSPRYTI